jgi:hypothetical protein
LRHPSGETQRRRAGAAADIENQLMRLGGNSGGEKDRIDRDARAVCRLPQPEAPAEEGILGERGAAEGLARAQCSSSSAAAMTAWARR